MKINLHFTNPRFASHRNIIRTKEQVIVVIAITLTRTTLEIAMHANNSYYNFYWYMR